MCDHRERLASARAIRDMLGHDGGDAFILEYGGIDLERALPPGEEGLAIVLAGGGHQPVEVLLDRPGERYATVPGDGLGPLGGLGSDREGERVDLRRLAGARRYAAFFGDRRSLISRSPISRSRERQRVDIRRLARARRYAGSATA